MKTYIYTILHDSNLRSYNRTITVFRIKHNKPYLVGTDNKINTASYKGDHSVACNIIHDIDKHALSECGYHLVSKNIRILNI